MKHLAAFVSAIARMARSHRRAHRITVGAGHARDQALPFSVGAGHARDQARPLTVGAGHARDLCRPRLLAAICLWLACGWASQSIAQSAPGHGTPEVPHAEVIVSPQWLQQALAGPQAQRPRVFNASWSEDGVAREYLKGHLPGAFHLDTERLETGFPRWALRTLPELQKSIGELGIAPEDTVVVYGARSIAAARAWWALMYAGVRDVRYLDGGLTAWQSAGLPVETRPNVPITRAFAAEPRTDFLISTEELGRRLDEPGLQLADTRGWAEFHGLTSGYDYAAFAGRIPRAIGAGNADDSAEIYQDASGKLLDPQKVLSRWRENGLDPATHEVVFYCGTGWRSSLAFLYAYALGLPKIRNYSDGWLGWSAVHLPDVTAKGPSPGWLQVRSGNPVESSLPVFLQPD